MYDKQRKGKESIVRSVVILLRKILTKGKNREGKEKNNRCNGRRCCWKKDGALAQKAQGVFSERKLYKQEQPTGEWVGLVEEISNWIR